MWSKLGRLKRSIMPKLTKGSALYGSGASSGIMSCIAGRLLCDTYLSSRDLLKEVYQIYTIFHGMNELIVYPFLSPKFFLHLYVSFKVSYSLTQLAKNQLNKDRKEISPHDIPVMFQTSAALLQLVRFLFLGQL